VEAHDLTEELEDRIREALPAIHINIHTEPYEAELRHQQEAHGAPAEEIPARMTTQRVQEVAQVRQERGNYAVVGPGVPDNGDHGGAEPHPGAR